MQQQNWHDVLYGPDVKVSHHLLQQFYFPFIEEKLLNDQVAPIYFNRFSKVISESGYLQTKFQEIEFTLHSADINLCKAMSKFVTYCRAFLSEKRVLVDNNLRICTLYGKKLLRNYSKQLSLLPCYHFIQDIEHDDD